jgi:hypothetical protein
VEANVQHLLKKNTQEMVEQVIAGAFPFGLNEGASTVSSLLNNPTLFPHSAFVGTGTRRYGKRDYQKGIIGPRAGSEAMRQNLWNFRTPIRKALLE